MRAVSVALLAVACVVRPGMAGAEPTEVMVRVLSKDAKFVGTSMGGVRVTLRDGHTGEILASGITRGGTGDTKQAMHASGGRRARLADETAARFVATLDLSEPRLVEVEAFGPLAQPQAAHRVVSSQWVVPGRHLSGGDGWVLELPGFVVDVLQPSAHVTLPPETRSVELRANVVMMCGCPVAPNGLWDAEKFEVAAPVTHDGRPAGRLALSYAGRTSQFAGTVAIEAPGVYDVLVYAHDPANGNTGVDRTTFIVAAR